MSNSWQGEGLTKESLVRLIPPSVANRSGLALPSCGNERTRYGNSEMRILLKLSRQGFPYFPIFGKETKLKLRV